MNLYVTARSVLGWSSEEFWESNPRMFYAFLHSYVQMQCQSNESVVGQKALVGKDALCALSEIAGNIR